LSSGFEREFVALVDCREWVDGLLPGLKRLTQSFVLGYSRWLPPGAGCKGSCQHFQAIALVSRAGRGVGAADARILECCTTFVEDKENYGGENR